MFIYVLEKIQVGVLVSDTRPENIRTPRKKICQTYMKYQGRFIIPRLPTQSIHRGDFREPALLRRESV